MKKVLMVFIALMCLIFTCCKAANNEDSNLIDSKDQVIDESDKRIIDEIIKQDFHQFEHISIIGAENETLRLLTHDETEKNNIINYLKLNEQEFLYKHYITEGDNPLNYLYYCIHIDFERENPSLGGNPSTNFYVSKEGRVFILFLTDPNEFRLYYTNKEVVNYQELHDYYIDCYDNWLQSYYNNYLK